MSEHTPGPWRIGGESVYDVRIQADAAIVFVADVSKSAGIQEGLANARLIAAAPALLQALRTIAMLASGAPHDDAALADQAFIKIMKRARAAIAKATQ